MMNKNIKCLFYLGHPAHYYLFKNTILYFKEYQVDVQILIKKKDILEDLCKLENIEYKNILPEGRKNNRFSLLMGVFKRDFRLLKAIRKNKPTIMLGSEVSIAHVGRLLGIPSVIFSEDDAEYIKSFAKLSYPFVTHIISPKGCSAWKWESKKMEHSSYHELAYLHPNHFTADKELIRSYVDVDKRYFILRFSELGAYHDDGKEGISNTLAQEIVDMLLPHGNVYITSERKLIPELEKYRITIPINLIHHAMYYASLLIADSQTMTAEAAVLGTPSVRYNDFVGKLYYLEELEHTYGLTYGVPRGDVDQLKTKIKYILEQKLDSAEWGEKRAKLLEDKIDFNQFMIDFIENYS